METETCLVCQISFGCYSEGSYLCGLKMTLLIALFSAFDDQKRLGFFVKVLTYNLLDVCLFRFSGSFLWTPLLIFVSFPVFLFSCFLSSPVVLMLLACCLLLPPLWESVIVLCFVVRYFMLCPF